jgi:hypothetical protein
VLQSFCFVALTAEYVKGLHILLVLIMVLKNQHCVSKFIFKIGVVAILALFLPVLQREETACEARNSSSLETNKHFG